MKKVIMLILALTVASGISASAQKNFKIGPKAGLSANWLPATNLDPGDKVLPHTSFYAGLSGEWDFTENALLQVEILYSGKGHSDRNDLAMRRYSLELGYLNIPVYAGFRFLDGQVGIMGGPEFGFNMLANRKISYIGDAPAGKDAGSKSVKESVRPFNIGLGLQVSYQFWEGLGLDLKLSWGLNRTFNDGKNAEGNIIKDSIDYAHNTSIQFGLFYKFEI